MSDENKNGIATAEDFLPREQGEEHRVKLPSGKVFLLRYLSMEFRVKRVIVAQSVAAVMQGNTPAETLEDVRAKVIAEAYRAVLCEVCISPKVSMEPKLGEIHPDQMDFPDAQFIARWAGGEIDADGNDLAAFRELKSSAAPSDGASGEAIRPMAIEPAGDEPVATAV